MVEIIWEPRGVIRHFFGDVTEREVDESAIRIQAHSEFDDKIYIINDFRDCTSLTISQEAIDLLAIRASVANQRKARFRSVIVGDLPAVKAMAKKIHEAGLYGRPFGRVDTMEEARVFVSAIL